MTLTDAEVARALEGTRFEEAFKDLLCSQSVNIERWGEENPADADALAALRLLAEAKGLALLVKRISQERWLPSKLIVAAHRLERRLEATDAPTDQS